MWYQIRDNDVVLTLHISPNAAHTRVAGLHGDALKITLQALPQDGAANAALINFLAEQCSLRKQQVEIIQGLTARRKKVKLPRTLSVEMFIKSV
ncbi:MAG: DUF167 domain-containing protein [Gammaproteobacteria bacterium]